MKISKLFYLLFLLINSSVLLSQEDTKELPIQDKSQAERRVERRHLLSAKIWSLSTPPLSAFQISGSGYDILLSYNLTYQYNFNKYFSFSFNYFRYNNQNEDIYLFPISNFLYRNYKNTLNLVFFDVKFFPFNKAPFFITSGIGRDLLGFGKFESLVSGTVARRGVLPFEYGLTKYSPTNVAILGFGIQWLFSTGVTLNFDFSAIINTSRKQEILYISSREIAGFNNFSFFFQRELNINEKAADSIISLSIGYSF